MLIKVNQLIPVCQNFCYAAKEENVTGAIELSLLLCKVCKPIGNCVCVCVCVCGCVCVENEWPVCPTSYIQIVWRTTKRVTSVDCGMCVCVCVCGCVCVYMYVCGGGGCECVHVCHKYMHETSHVQDGDVHTPNCGGPSEVVQSPRFPIRDRQFIYESSFSC